MAKPSSFPFRGPQRYSGSIGALVLWRGAINQGTEKVASVEEERIYRKEEKSPPKRKSPLEGFN